jgi:diacylglycerol kinase family enzyme
VSTEAHRPVTGRRRALAWLAIVCAALLAGWVLVFSYRNLGHLAGVLVGFGVAVAGGWWLITERPPRRWIGLAGTVAGLAIAAVAFIDTAADADYPFVRLATALLLFAVMSGAARLAAEQDLHDLDDNEPHEVNRPRHPVLICNPWSGGGKVEKFGLVERATELGVETVMLDHGLDLEQLARDAVARGADCLGMAGGDGSQALVASIAVELGLPFVCVSAGTRNHFALDLGIDRNDPRNSLDAFRDAVERRIDHATVNGRFFVNNVSLGVYATIVQQDGYREAKVETTRALLPEMLGRTDKPFDLQFTEPDGTEVDGAFLIQVSNNPYALDAFLDATERRSLDTGRLGVIALTAATGKDAAGMVTLAALGKHARTRSRNWHELTAESFEVRSRSGKAYAGVDGEALEMDTPLEFRIHPRALRLLVPAGNLEIAARRRGRDYTLGEILRLAVG